MAENFIGNQQVGLQMLWGCDPSRQLEVGWLHSLLKPLQQVANWAGNSLPLNPGIETVLVESGLHYLEHSPDPARVEQVQQQRRSRLRALQRAGSFGLIHLSDEEGLDGDLLYPLLPPGTPVWRNFPYPRFKCRRELRMFPIGPRVEFLRADLQPLACRPASTRPFPWAFMGTLWASGSRTLAASVFLRAMPKGFFYGGRGFAQGLPLAAYQQRLLLSSFALCPEGDRHLDTFRLYESLQAGCIPVLVDQRGMARDLLGAAAPLPVFPNWLAALGWVQGLLASPCQLDCTQMRIARWWQQRHESLGIAMRHTFNC